MYSAGLGALQQPAIPGLRRSVMPVAAAVLAPLTDDQKERIARAKAYAKEQTVLLLEKKASMPAVIPPTVQAAIASASVSSVSSPAIPVAIPSLGGSVIPTPPIPVPPHLPQGLTPADIRTITIMSKIYIGSISFEITEVHIREVFIQFGSIRSITMNLDPLTGKHKGYCFVEYDYPESAELALDSMGGAEFGGRTLKVGRPNNYNAAIGQSIPQPISRRIFVANVNENVTEEMVKSIFEAFGEVTAVAFMPDALTRKHRGCGYVEFKEDTSASSALVAMKGGSFELGGMKIRTWPSLIGGDRPEGMKALEKMPVIDARAMAALPQLATSTQLLHGGANVNPTPPALASAVQSAIQRVQAQVMDEGNSLEESMTMSASQRYLIMQKLAKSHEEQQILKTAESPVVQFQNMINRGEVDPDLRGEITEECGKHGKVLEVVLWAKPSTTPSNSDSVSVFVKFGSPAEAAKAILALNGRWFAGRQIAATYLSVAKLEAIVTTGEGVL